MESKAEKIAPRTRSEVGRVAREGGPARRWPLARPAITRMASLWRGSHGGGVEVRARLAACILNRDGDGVRLLLVRRVRRLTIEEADHGIRAGQEIIAVVSIVSCQ